MIHLAHDIITGKRQISSLTLEECTALMERFSGEDDVAILQRDIEQYALDETESLKHAQLGAKVAIHCVEDDDEYFTMYGTY
jgi:hypothetical protein